MELTPEQTRFFEALYQEHHNAMRHVAQKIVKDPEAAADAVSQAFLIAILKLDVVMGCESPEKWLFHVLKNTAIDEYRRRRRAEIPMEYIPEPWSEAELISFDDLLPEGLTAGEREILSLRIERGLDYDEIARRLELSAAACRMKYSRARRRCAQLMRSQR